MNDSTISHDDINHCIRTLEALVDDRTQLAALPEALRIALLTAAGRLSRPTRWELTSTAKIRRRVQHVKIRQADRDIRAEAETRRVRAEAVYVAPVRRTADPLPPLTEPRTCYVCKAEFRNVHFFYDSMCISCADYNYEKRFQTADLVGKTALLTGSRVKIGFQIGLRLLRAGARLIATTRFPHDCAARYAREEDFDTWKDRLEIHGLDLRHVPSVEIFTRYLLTRESRLDILINNAAQTVRRPPGWYAHLLEREALPASDLTEAERHLLAARQQCLELMASVPRIESLPGTVETGLSRWSADGPGLGLRESAQLSQARYSYDEEACPADLFPAQRVDADLQQVDLRENNSWRLKLAEVATPEMLEVHLVNAVAPFILCGKLKPLMLVSPDPIRHIVNVSAMEGSFSRKTKTDKHPHTNMAKAALNMMTLTSAPDYVKDGIFMNAVDTGWVTDEDPLVYAERKRTEHDFHIPLDIVDGAARVVDPVFSGFNNGDHVYGQFLKDYKQTEW